MVSFFLSELSPLNPESLPNGEAPLEGAKWSINGGWLMMKTEMTLHSDTPTR